MTDRELAGYLGLTLAEAIKFRRLWPEKVEVFTRMRSVERDLELWQAGLLPKPEGVLVDTVRSTRNRRAWR